jgi:hypothetical protein
MLEAPRSVLVRAALPLIPLDAPPNAFLFVALGVLGTSRLPTRSPPPPARFAPMLLAPPPAGRVEGFPPPAPRFIVLGCCREFCLAWFCRAFACRVAVESPRAVPPYLLAVAWFEYGVPPRCCGLCCQLLPPPAGWLLGRLMFPVLMLPLLMFVLL